MAPILCWIFILIGFVVFEIPAISCIGIFGCMLIDHAHYVSTVFFYRRLNEHLVHDWGRRDRKTVFDVCSVWCGLWRIGLYWEVQVGSCELHSPVVTLRLITRIKYTPFLRHAFLGQNCAYYRQDFTVIVCKKTIPSNLFMICCICEGG